MKTVFEFILTYKKTFFTLGMIGLFLWYLYRGVSVVIFADFSTQEVESQTQQIINQIVNSL
ncbi:MAG: hypothetical protein ABEI13_00895 [Candidatus Paceibacteria bacterium]